MEVEVPENEDTTFAVSEDAVEQRIDWGKAVQIASKIKRTLSPEEVAPEIEMGVLTSRAQQILDSLETPKRDLGEKSDIKSDYLKELVRRVKAVNEKV